MFASEGFIQLTNATVIEKFEEFQGLIFQDPYHHAPAV